MMTVDEYQTRLYMAIDTDLPLEMRSDLVMQFFHMTRANLRALLGMVENTDPSDPIHQLAQDQLETLYGFLTEALKPHRQGGL